MPGTTAAVRHLVRQHFSGASQENAPARAHAQMGIARKVRRDLAEKGGDRRPASHTWCLCIASEGWRWGPSIRELQGLWGSRGPPADSDHHWLTQMRPRERSDLLTSPGKFWHRLVSGLPLPIILRSQESRKDPRVCGRQRGARGRQPAWPAVRDRPRAKCRGRLLGARNVASGEEGELRLGVG